MATEPGVSSLAVPSMVKQLQSQNGQGAVSSPDPLANGTSGPAELSQSREAPIAMESDASSGGSGSDRASAGPQGSGSEEAQSNGSIGLVDSGANVANGATGSGVSGGLPDDAADGATASGSDRLPGSAVAKMRQLLHRRTRIEVADGRVFIGKLHCLDKQGNIILFDAQEYAPQTVAPKHNSPRSPSDLKSPRGMMADEGERFDRILRGESEDVPLETAPDELQTHNKGPLGSPLAPVYRPDPSLGSSMGERPEVLLRAVNEGAAAPDHGRTSANGERSTGDEAQMSAEPGPSPANGDGGAQSLVDLLPSPPTALASPRQQVAGELPRHAGQEPGQERSSAAMVEKSEEVEPTLVEQRRLGLVLIPAKVRVSCKVECDVEEELALLALS